MCWGLGVVVWASSLGSVGAGGSSELPLQEQGVGSASSRGFDQLEEFVEITEGDSLLVLSGVLSLLASSC